MIPRCVIAVGFAVLFFAVACERRETAANDNLLVDEAVDTDTVVDQSLPEAFLERDETGLNTEEGETPEGEEIAAEDDVMSDSLFLDEPGDVPEVSDQTEASDEDLCDSCILPAEVTCQPTAAPCDAAPVDTNVYASYRKDFYYAHYQEGDVLNPIPAPVNGGRFQITGIAAAGGKVTAVKLNGVNVADLLAQTKLDWYHVYPLTFTEGEAFWVNFHSREASWDNASIGHLTVETEQGTAFDGVFTYAVNQVPLKYVTFADDYKTLIIHIENRMQNPVMLTKLLYNGLSLPPRVCRQPSFSRGLMFSSQCRCAKR